uniref:Uncharacterized protein n=1 Tax=Cairina moschata TaxID=8855 RepID=A0A8C3D039_CAIMO
MPFPLPGWYRHNRSLLPWAKIRALLVSASPTARGTLLQLEHCPRLQGTLPVALGHLLCHGIPFVRASLLSPHLLCHGTSAPLPHTAPDTRQRGISRRVGQVHPCQGEREGRDPKEGCHAAVPAPCSLPASVLQGFQCSQAHQLPAATVLALAREMRNKSVELSSAQLSCLAQLLAASNLTADFSGYPPDLLLFFDVAEVRGDSCEEFYSLAARGNLELLPRGSAQRRAILHGALACVGASGSHLSLKQLGSLGALVCDLEPDTITASDPGILENLKLCPALMEAQRGAVNAVLLGGGTVYGCSSSITAITCPFHRAFLGAVRSHDEIRARCRGKTSTPELSSPPAGCMSTPITPSTLSDSLLIIDYETPEQFYLCLSYLVLQNSLARVLEQPLTMEYLQMVKKKLQEMYPAGIPDEQLRLLGPLSRQFTAQEIRQWQVTSSDTLCALLNPLDGTWSAAQVPVLLGDTGGRLVAAKAHLVAVSAVGLTKGAACVLQKLSVMDVKNLLGTEVQELKKAENQTAVLSWIKKQSQEELDRILGIGLHGGMEERLSPPDCSWQGGICSWGAGPSLKVQGMANVTKGRKLLSCTCSPSGYLNPKAILQP